MPTRRRCSSACCAKGPTELHGCRGDRALVHRRSERDPALIAQAQTDRGPTRHEVVRALGASLRNKPDPAARKALRALADDANIKVAVAAIGGLAAGAAARRRAVPAHPRRESGRRSPSRRRVGPRRAARRGRDSDAVRRALREGRPARRRRRVGARRDCRRAADASTSALLVERLLYLAKHGGWAAAINGTGALARCCGPCRATSAAVARGCRR